MPVETLKVRESALAQADSLLRDNRTREQVGILTHSDVLEAESAMLQRRQEVLDQENVIRDYEDNLRRFLNLTSDEDWSIRFGRNFQTRDSDSRPECRTGPIVMQ